MFNMASVHMIVLMATVPTCIVQASSCVSWCCQSRVERPRKFAASRATRMHWCRKTWSRLAASRSSLAPSANHRRNSWRHTATQTRAAGSALPVGMTTRKEIQPEVRNSWGRWDLRVGHATKNGFKDWRCLPLLLRIRFAHLGSVVCFSKGPVSSRTRSYILKSKSAELVCRF